ncbi:NAD(P)/FAD-dependent oxidoreductase [Arthrobacter sp. I2-34]|uniref:NAD(P)/FAD-dependent oxidoreductase n=1 Tax=Arthrobacter hankyongi TaxID=2904801 RepID=A0ABS9LDE8_9MICC|nr:NAD(P)/FAD-dependent oxidoreductase [Arthrobacter hankyongi]MCG2624721.1 NAD(P)/FAD-dependent oxidoreductase [Arthrobacter hankyongi]
MNTNPLDRGSIEQNLLQADTAALLLALVEDTGDDVLLEEYRPYISNPLTLSEDFSEEARQRIARLVAERFVGGGLRGESITSAPDRFRRLSEEAAQRHVEERELDLFRKEMGLLEDAFVDWAGERPAQTDQYRVIIVGAGLSGIATAIHLKRMGINFTIFDRYDGAGGTWLVNTYPGCAVDILSHYFSYSFRRKNDWTSYYSPQPEVLQYLREVVAEFGLEEHIRFGTTVKSAKFDEGTQRWMVHVEDRGGGAARRGRVLRVRSGRPERPQHPRPARHGPVPGAGRPLGGLGPGYRCHR